MLIFINPSTLSQASAMKASWTQPSLAQNQWRYEPDPDLTTPAAAYGSGLIKNQPFIDGNSRIGSVTANMFLILSGP